MRAKESRTFGDLEITVVQLPAMKGLAIANKLMRMLGPGLAGLVSELKATESLSDMDIGGVSRALEGLLKTLEPEAVESLVRSLLDKSTVVHPESNGKAVDFLGSVDELLAGKVMTLYKVLVFAVEVNYTDFFDMVKSKLKAPAKGPALLSKSPNT